MRTSIKRKQVHKFKSDRLPPEIINKIKARNYTRRQFQKYRNPRDYELFRQLNTEIKDAITQDTNSHWSDLLGSLKTANNSFWRVVKSTKPKAAGVAPLKINLTSSHAHNDKDKAEILADQYASVCAADPTLTKEQQNVTEQVNNFVAANRKVSEITETTPNAIKQIIKKLPATKAPGPKPSKESNCTHSTYYQCCV